MLISQSVVHMFAAEDIYPSDGGYRLNTTSIRASWLLFAGPGEVASFCKSHGVLKTSSPLPNGVRRGKARNCFQNAGLLALKYPTKFTYCEGWAQMPSCNELTTAHAWCLDRKGNVVDPTWEYEEGCEYLGLPVKTLALQEKICATEVWGFFPDGRRLPKGYFANPEAFIESNFADGSIDELF